MDLSGLRLYHGQTTGSVTEYALASFVRYTADLSPSTLVGLISSPLGGWMVDRYNHRYLILISDLIAELAAVAVALSYMYGTLEV